MTDRPTDDDIARALRDDDDAPPAHLDARIRAAARAAASPRRRWHLPAGLAAAASVVLAVLVVRQAPLDLPVTEDAAREGARLEAREEKAAGATAERTAAPASAAAEAPARAQSLLADEATWCAGTAIDLPGYRVCVDAGGIAVQGPGRCGETARLSAADGNVTARAGQADDVHLLVDGAVRWRLRCTAGDWRITPADG